MGKIIANLIKSNLFFFNTAVLCLNVMTLVLCVLSWTFTNEDSEGTLSYSYSNNIHTVTVQLA